MVVLALWPCECMRRVFKRSVASESLSCKVLSARWTWKWQSSGTKDRLYMGNLLSMVCTRIGLFLLHLNVIYLFRHAEGKSKGHQAITEALSCINRLAIVCYSPNNDLWHCYLKYRRLLNFFPGLLYKFGYCFQNLLQLVFLSTCWVPFEGFLFSFHV